MFKCKKSSVNFKWISGCCWLFEAFNINRMQILCCMLKMYNNCKIINKTALNTRCFCSQKSRRHPKRRPCSFFSPILLPHQIPHFFLNKRNHFELNQSKLNWQYLMGENYSVKIWKSWDVENYPGNCCSNNSVRDFIEK